MTKYLIVKRVNLRVGVKTFRKDRIITVEDVGQRNLDRYLSKGYIKALDEAAEGNISEDIRRV